MIEFLSWDWKGDLEVGQLKQAVEALGAGVYVYEVETGIDERMAALSDTELTPVEVDRAYRQWVGLAAPPA